jgi:hypothetical protein
MSLTATPTAFRLTFSTMYNDIMTMKEAKSIIAVLRVSRVYGASALWVCEIILWLVRAFLRVPAMPFLWVAELYYRLRRFRRELWADAMDAEAAEGGAK